MNDFQETTEHDGVVSWWLYFESR